MTTLSLALLISAPGLFACRQNPLVKRANPSPRAAAGQDVMVAQAPATVTLDASGSTDDGQIVAYRWLSGTPRPDQMPGRYTPPTVPELERATWPGTNPTVTLTLPEGVWIFSLWVTDDQGAISDPDTVKITVGTPPAPVGGAGGGAGMGAP